MNPPLVDMQFLLFHPSLLEHLSSEERVVQDPLHTPSAVDEVVGNTQTRGKRDNQPCLGARSNKPEIKTSREAYQTVMVTMTNDGSAFSKPWE